MRAAISAATRLATDASVTRAGATYTACSPSCRASARSKSESPTREAATWMVTMPCRRASANKRDTLDTDAPIRAAISA